MSNLIIGVIEWSSESGSEPTVFVGETEAQVRRAAVELLAPMVAREEIEYVDEEWLSEYPAPDLDDEVAVKAWLRKLWEASTGAWFGLYGAKGTETGKAHDTFTDVR